MKVLCYVAKLTGGLSAKQNADLSRKLLIFSSKISGARTTLRLIDDIPLLQYTLEYGWGKQVSVFECESVPENSTFHHSSSLMCRNRTAPCPSSV